MKGFSGRILEIDLDRGNFSMETIGDEILRKYLGRKGLAARICNDTRRFNIREGLRPEDDDLPCRFYGEALPETGKIITRPEMRHMIRDYYNARGWDGRGTPPG